jgi:uncharacterized RDD family membrane protein YckC
VAGGQLEYDPDHDDAIRAAAHQATPRERHELAGWWSRVGAYLLDVLLLAIVLGICIGIAFAISDALGIFVVIIAIFVYLLGYWVYFEGGPEGQTIGKRALGIRVRADDGSRAGYGRALGRNLVARVIAFFPFVGLVDVLWPLWDDRNQCLHDKAASTIVIRV